MSNKIWPLLRRRFPNGEYAVLQEVSNGAGSSRTNYADGIIMNLWPSRGLEMQGIEVKISRGDWLRELKKPAKAEAFVKYCDRWWLVIGDASIVLPAEIPASWGCMAVKGERLIVVKDAPKLTPIPIDKSFTAALLMRATKGLIHPSEIKDKIDEGVAIKMVTENRDHTYLKGNYESLLKKVREFEDSSGIMIEHAWDAGEVGKAVAIIKRGTTTYYTKQLTELKKVADKIAGEITESIKILEALKPAEPLIEDKK